MDWTQADMAEVEELSRPRSGCVDGPELKPVVQSSNHMPKRTSASIKSVSQRLLWQNLWLLESPWGANWEAQTGDILVPD